MKYDIMIDYVHFVSGAMIIGWSAMNIGFGELTISNNEDGSFSIDTEQMSNDFRDQVLEEMIKFLVK